MKSMPGAGDFRTGFYRFCGLSNYDRLPYYEYRQAFQRSVYKGLFTKVCFPNECLLFFLGYGMMSGIFKALGRGPDGGSLEEGRRLGPGGGGSWL